MEPCLIQMFESSALIVFELCDMMELFFSILGIHLCTILISSQFVVFSVACFFFCFVYSHR